ncbi:MAG: M48 family metalloprotease, partial [Pseudomonadota bacterium]
MIGALVALVLGMTIAVAPHPVRAEGGGLILMSPEQEKKIGAEQHPKILEEFGGAYDVPEIGGYVAELGGRLVAKSEMAGQTFTFTVLNSPVVNAFALPGGYVYISRGLMALANSEAELAGVLGHEVGHVTRRHSARRYTRAVGAGILSEVARIGGAIMRGDAAGQILGQVAGMGSQLYVLKYSRDQEYEADEVGILYIDRVGYDPFAMADFLDSMQDQSVLAAQLQGFAVDPNQVDYFSTHPNTGERVRRATQNALGTGAIAGDLPARRDAYLDLIDGLLYGDDPKEGLVVDGQFVHPDLRFRFDVPDGFSVQNSPSAVRGRHESGGQFVFAGVRSNKGSSLAVINDTFRDREGGRLEQIRATEING